MKINNRVKGFWNQFFCSYYGKALDFSFDTSRCKTCPKKKLCFQKFYRKVRKYSKIYGDITEIPSEKLE